MNLKDEIIDVLKLCFDPEIPVDLWSLGLIYSIDIEPSKLSSKDKLILHELLSNNITNYAR